MVSCKNCRPAPKPEASCVFAIYKAKVGGKTLSFCCESSRKSYLGGIKKRAKKAPAKKPAKAKVQAKAARKRK